MFIDLTSYTFDDWINFVFDHPVPEESETEWYWENELDLEGEPIWILQYCIQLFRYPEFLLDRFSAPQIDQGFWFMMIPPSSDMGCLVEWIWDRQIDRTVREECILAMIHVFERLFAMNPIGSVCFMWWDLLQSPVAEKPDHQVKGAILQALERILRLDSPHCRMAALHGLGHLTLPDRVPVIENFLSAHPELDAETRAYALSAMAGRIL